MRKLDLISKILKQVSDDVELWLMTKVKHHNLEMTALSLRGCPKCHKEDAVTWGRHQNVDEDLIFFDKKCDACGERWGHFYISFLKERG